MSHKISFIAFAAAWGCAWSGQIIAGEATPSPAAAPAVAAVEAQSPASGSIGLELNKVETYEKGCRFFMVVNITAVRIALL